MLMLPELAVIITAFVVFMADLLFQGRRGRTISAALSLGGLGFAGVITLFFLPHAGEMLGGRFAIDSVTWWFKILFLLAALVTIAISTDMFEESKTVPSVKVRSCGEYYTILLFTVSGMMFLASARDLVTLYVSLELATIPLFALAAWRKDSISGEAGLKYVVIGALASGLLLYGLGIFYGLTGETSLDAIGKALSLSPALWLGVALVAAGVGFKLTLVPFHMWAPDVYQGAPTPVTAYLSVASKGAGLVLMLQLFYRVLGQFVPDWAFGFALLAAATMTLGNVVAIVQSNIKRFMAFSAISQAGYLIMGFLGVSGENVSAMLYYMLVYIVTNLAVFSVIIVHSNQTGREEIGDYRGLSRTNPVIAFAMMLGLFSLAGIPPLSGFVGKFFLFSIASKAGFQWLVALAAINSTVSLYYYLRIVREMYIEAVPEGVRPLRMTPWIGSALGVTTVSIETIGWLRNFVH
jgi:NADH-quinone oxidoreductase subunit N